MNFTNFLEGKHADVYTGLDDEMPDAFDNWLSQLDVDKLIEFADEYTDFRMSAYPFNP